MPLNLDIVNTPSVKESLLPSSIYKCADFEMVDDGTEINVNTVNEQPDFLEPKASVRKSRTSLTKFGLLLTDNNVVQSVVAKANKKIISSPLLKSERIKLRSNSNDEHKACCSTSRDADNTCFVCGGFFHDDPGKIKWIKCLNCKQWFHNACQGLNAYKVGSRDFKCLECLYG